METRRTPKITDRHQSRLRYSFTVGTLGIAARALSRTDTATQLEARQLAHMAMTMEMLAERPANLRTISGTPCKMTTPNQRAAPFRTAMVAKDGIASWNKTRGILTKMDLCIRRCM